MRNGSLPPNVTNATFGVALEAFRAALGGAFVVTSSEGLAAYLDPFAPGDATTHAASAAVLPANVDDIRAVLRIANLHRIPLWTVSTGRNFAYGGAAPRIAGSVVLDLKRMNQILEVDETLSYALVEPGVSYFDLYQYLLARRSALWLDPPAAGWGSVVGNTLERGFGTTPYGDHAAMQCGMEVVLANGDVVRTGMGAMRESRSWQVFKPGFGPSYDGMFMQSNFGVVTKMGIWLMPRPAGFRLCHFKFRHDSDLATIIDTLRPLRLDETIQSQVVVEHGVRWAAGVSTRSQWYKGAGPMPDRAIDAMVSALGIGWWNMRFCLYGPEDLVAARLSVIQRAFSAIADARLDANPWMPSTAVPQGGGDQSQVGIPGMAAFQLLNWRGGSGAHIDFSPICPPTGRDALAQYDLVRTRAAEFGFDYYGGFTAGPRHMHHIFAAIFNKDDPNQTQAARSLLATLIEQCGKAGYGQYRTHLDYMESAAAQYDFNDHSLMRLSESIKLALDPQGILSPGKQGIGGARFTA